MQRVKPCLWFDDNAEQASKFYTGIFGNSKVGAIARYSEDGAKPSGREPGSVMTVEFQLEGQDFLALNGGPMFKFSPAVSLTVSCDTEEEINRLYNQLSEGGTVLMEPGSYDFSPKYACVNDKYGVNWGLNLTHRKQKIAPALMFVGDLFGKAEEAVNFYVSRFENSSIINITRYGVDELGPVGTVKHATFSLDGYEFMALDSSYKHEFTFTPAISFVVNCHNQDEVDDFWGKLAEGGMVQQCGWLGDRFGICWQIVPTALGEMMKDPDTAKTGRVMGALLTMVKLDIAALEKAYKQS
ncbi:MAG: VOC family protein [Candidatus Obscuribacterales bacterium]|nr:VOC family protein [Candidatus Obscuribacterales bacterium]